MDHMRISGTESSSVIRSKTKKFKKLNNNAKQVSKQAEAERDGVIITAIITCFDVPRLCLGTVHLIVWGGGGL